MRQNVSKVRIFGLLMALISLIVMIAWLMDLNVLKSMSHDYVILKIYTAMPFVLFSLLVWISVTSWISIKQQSQIQKESRLLILKDQTALIESEATQRLEKITNALPVIISYINSKETYLFANSTYGKWFGIPYQSIIGKTISDVLGEVNRNAVWPTIEKVIQTGISNDFEGSLKIKSGVDIAYHAFYVPDFDSAGRVKGCIALGTDVSERRAFQQEILQEKIRAEAANVAKTNFLANISHEIRTPLGAVLGFADMLTEKVNSSPELDEIATAIKRNGDQLIQLIDDLLDISKIETGNIQLEKQHLKLSDLVSDIYMFAKMKAEQKSISLDFTIEPTDVNDIYSDRVRVKQCLMNVINNAIKFTDKGGFVKISVHASQIKSPNILFRITDNGIGISPENSKALFEPFNQGDISTTRKHGGTGLGLALSRRIARALGGDIILEKSELGNGSTFLITINGHFPNDLTINPTLIDSCSAEKHDTELKLNRLQGLRILLVEDSSDNRLLIRRLLEKEKAEVTFAVDGQEGFRQAKESRFDVILMDIQMPNLDGYQTLKLLKEINHPAPVIAVTAHALVEDHRRSLQAGFVNHITKPVQREELVGAILKCQSLTKV